MKSLIGISSYSLNFSELSSTTQNEYIFSIVIYFDVKISNDFLHVCMHAVQDLYTQLSIRTYVRIYNVKLNLGFSYFMYLLHFILEIFI